MSFNIIYDSGRSDIISILTYVNSITKGMGVEGCRVDPEILFRIDQIMRQDFPHNDGLEKANPFKKAATFACYLIAEKPILDSFPESIIGKDLARISNHQNAIIAYLMARDSLHGAAIHRSDGDVKLDSKITVSKHSFCDIVDAMANITPATGFKLLTVLFEQLAYRWNPQASYQTTI